MKIQYASDLHIEFRANQDWLREHPLEVTGDVLVLAGDVMYIEDCAWFWDWAGKNYRRVLAVPGNHEFYGADLDDYGLSFEKPIYENVAYYHNKVVRIDDTDFILSTLWSHIPPGTEEAVSDGIHDFDFIDCNGRSLSVDEYNRQHRISVDYIRDAVRNSDARHVVVVTHHAPSLLTIATEHLTSPLRYAFATDLHWLMEDGRIDYWVYGHSHTNVNCRVFNTEIICNQLGYVFHDGQMKGFRLDKNFEI